MQRQNSLADSGQTLVDGKRIWKEGRFGHGQMILANETQLLVTTESGGVKLIEPSPEKLRVRAEMQVFDEKTWNSPSLAGDFLLLRNHKEAACYRLNIVPGDSMPGPR